MQGQVIDLSAIIRPGSVQSALATGMLGIQPKPVLAEVIAWFAAAIPLMLFVLWPSSPSSRRSPAAAGSQKTTPIARAARTAAS